MVICIRMGYGWTTVDLPITSIIAASIPVIAKMIFMERFISKLMSQGSLWQFRFICDLWRMQNVETGR